MNPIDSPITDELVEALWYNAMYGAIAYWAEVDLRSDSRCIAHIAYRPANKYTDEAMVTSDDIRRGLDRLHDLADGEENYYTKAYWDILEDTHDDQTADIVVQLALFDRVIF